LAQSRLPLRTSFSCTTLLLSLSWETTLLLSLSPASENCAPNMSLLNTGFQGGVCCPWWLLDVVYDDCAVVIPLNSGCNGQTNPIYQMPPSRPRVNWSKARRRGKLEMKEKRHAAMMHAGGLQPGDNHMHQHMRTTCMHGADVAAPYQMWRKMIVSNCSVKVVARGFVVGQVGNHFFVAAEVECENFGVKGYMNIWHGWGDGGGPGTLYCALEYQPQFRFNCLCGVCQAGWFEHGWVCPLLEGWQDGSSTDGSSTSSDGSSRD
jgi:hypothetical protein